MFSMNSLRSLLALLCALCFFVAPNANAGLRQTSTGTLTGIVQDSTGAVLPNVTVSVTNIDRNSTQFTMTNETGGYVLPALNPGNYSVSAELAGFKKFAREGLVIQVNQVARVDIRLGLGSIEEAVEVKAAAPLLETETSGRGSVIDRQKIMELSLNGRNYDQLALLAPGVVPSTPRLAVLNFKGAPTLTEIGCSTTHFSSTVSTTFRIRVHIAGRTYRSSSRRLKRCRNSKFRQTRIRLKSAAMPAL